ncbi:MAG: hypothetical protein CME25_13415 [Gemmatimonadetes bacterium]|nr:hypothetical protein [Gemmatimonadota bacterium]
MLHKSMAIVLAACMFWTSVVGTGELWAAETKKQDEATTEESEKDEERPRGHRTIEGMDDGDGWRIVDVRNVKGKLVVISPRVGREIDLEESNRDALFQGRTVFNERIRMRLFDMAVPGLQSAVFLKRGKDRYMIRVSYRSGKDISSRSIPLDDENELRRIREYIENFDAISKKKYTLGSESKIEKGADYPKFTDEEVAFEERRPRFRLAWRLPGGVVLKGGEKVQGELVPAFEDGKILVQTDIDTRRVPVEDIDRVFIKGAKSSAAVGAAVQGGIGGMATGALVGALAAWQSGGNAKETAIFAGLLFGAIGFVSGLFRGASRGRGNREFVLGPVERGKGGDSEEGGRGRRRR